MSDRSGFGTMGWRTGAWIGAWVLLLAGATLGCRDPRQELLAEIARVEDQRRAADGVLARAAASGEPEVQARAALAMGRMQEPDFAEPLAALAAPGSDPEVRLAALFALGQLGLAEDARVPPAAAEAVRESLVEEDPRVVAVAAEALGKLAPEGAAEPLAKLLGHVDSEVRAEAAMALFRLRYVPVWRRQAEAAPELPPAATEALLRALEDPSPEVRWRVAHGFSRYGEPAATAALATALMDDYEWTRLFAARALGLSGDETSVPTLIALLGDESPRVRTEAVRSLSARGAAGQIPATMTSDPSFHVRAALASTLGLAEGEAGLATLRELEADASSSVRAAALSALARRLGAGYREALEARLREGSWVEKTAAARALAVLESQALELLGSAFDDPDPRVKAAAIETLGRLRIGLEYLRKALASEDLGVRGTAVAALGEWRPEGALELLAKALTASPGVDWIEVRETVAAALGEIEGGEALLEELALGDSAPSVRRRAATLLAKKGARPLPGPPPPVPASPFLGEDLPPEPEVVFETEKGSVEIRCLPAAAPIHVANFLSLVEKGFYDGLIWHRVVPNFVIQGGDPRGDGWGGPGYTLRDEIHPDARYLRGAVGMPKAGKDTGGGQLFITHIPTPHLDGNYTIFGQVSAGMEVVDEIEMGDRIFQARVKE